jgi:serine/threonine-protein kinase HipA
LFSVLQYGGFDTELAMAYGDVFEHEKVSAFALADFAVRCGIDRNLMRREGQRLAKLVAKEATVQALSDSYQSEAAVHHTRHRLPTTAHYAPIRNDALPHKGA